MHACNKCHKVLVLLKKYIKKTQTLFPIVALLISLVHHFDHDFHENRVFYSFYLLRSSTYFNLFTLISSFNTYNEFRRQMGNGNQVLTTAVR